MLQWLNSAIASPLGGFLWNLFQAPGQQERFDRFEERQDQLLNERASTLNMLGLGGPFAGASGSGGGFDRSQIGAAQGAGGMSGATNLTRGGDDGFGHGALGDVNRLGHQMGQFGDQFFNPDAALGRFDAAFGDIESMIGGLPGQFQSGMAGLQRGFDQRLGRARGIVDQIGGQERADVNRRFNEQQGRVASDLRRSGLGTSTVAPTVASGLERERGSELRRLADDDAMRRLGVESSFGGEALGARERGLFGAADLGMGAANMLSGIAGARFGAQDAAAMNRFNTMMQAGMLSPMFQTELARLQFDSFPQFAPPESAFANVLPNA